MPSRDLVALRGLLDRVRAAKGPDRGLFCDIGEALMGDLDSSTWCRVLLFVEVEAWTDAALLLVERALPEHDWIIGHTNGGLTIHARIGPKAEDFGNTPPLAILAALLSALIAQEERTDGR